MKQRQLQEQVNQILQQQSPLKTFTSQMALEGDLGFDSLSLVSLVVALEESFRLTLDVADLDPERFHTVQDLYDLAEKYVNQ